MKEEKSQLKGTTSVMLLIVLSALGIAFIGLAGVFPRAARSDPSTSFQAIAQDHATTTITSTSVVTLENIRVPMYSDAKILQDSIQGDGVRQVTYLSALNPAAMVAYYKQGLSAPGQGWKLITVVGYYRSYYLWTDPLGITPWHFELEFSAVLDASQVPFDQGGGSRVGLRLKRYPSVKNIPLFPGAQKVEVTSQPYLLGDASSPAVTTTTFLVSATREEVYTFYQSELDKLAWKPLITYDMHSPQLVPVYVKFGAYRASAGNLLEANVELSTTPHDGGRTQVRIDVWEAASDAGY